MAWDHTSAETGQIRQAVHSPRLVGQSAPVLRLRSQIEAVAQRRCTVIVQGDTGTGKELVARHIHAASDRARRPFVPVDCTTLRDTLSESQLFGHIKGAFTGAHQNTLGFMRAADGGTLFLDEIGEMPLTIQAMLLRCLEERAVVPLGGVKAVPMDVRVVVATHRDLAAMVEQGTFREDLYYRLNVAKVQVPPLRDRKDDIEHLGRYYLGWFADLYQEPVKELSPIALAVLKQHDWPGNVRELSNAIEHAAVFSTSRQLQPSDLPDSVRAGSGSTVAGGRIVPIEQAERQLIVDALHATNGNQSRAAELLAVERRWLRRRIVRYQLQELAQRRLA